MVRKTREEALKTKLKIMDVAKQLFCEKGYEKTNLSDIADVAGARRWLTQSLIYSIRLKI